MKYLLSGKIRKTCAVSLCSAGLLVREKKPVEWKIFNENLHFQSSRKNTFEFSVVSIRFVSFVNDEIILFKNDVATFDFL